MSEQILSESTKKPVLQRDELLAVPPCLDSMKFQAVSLLFIGNGNDPVILLLMPGTFRGQLRREFDGAHFKAAFSPWRLLPFKTLLVY